MVEAQKIINPIPSASLINTNLGNSVSALMNEQKTFDPIHKPRVDNGDDKRDVDEIAAEINSLRDYSVFSCIKIGWLLIRAKKLLTKRGMWLKWLSENVDMSYKMVQRYMQLARAYPNPGLVAGLGMTKALILLAVPGDYREYSIKVTHDFAGVQKSVIEMTVRELRQVIYCELNSDEEVSNRELASDVDEDRDDNISSAINRARNNLDTIVSFLTINKENPDATERFREGISILNKATQSCMELLNTKIS